MFPFIHSLSLLITENAARIERGNLDEAARSTSSNIVFYDTDRSSTETTNEYIRLVFHVKRAQRNAFWTRIGEHFAVTAQDEPYLDLGRMWDRDLIKAARPSTCDASFCHTSDSLLVRAMHSDEPLSMARTLVRSGNGLDVKGMGFKQQVNWFRSFLELVGWKPSVKAVTYVLWVRRVALGEGRIKIYVSHVNKGFRTIKQMKEFTMDAVPLYVTPTDPTDPTDPSQPGPDTDGATEPGTEPTITATTGKVQSGGFNPFGYVAGGVRNTANAVGYLAGGAGKLAVGTAGAVGGTLVRPFRRSKGQKNDEIEQEVEYDQEPEYPVPERDDEEPSRYDY